MDQPSREESIVASYLGGATLKEIGFVHGLSDERIRQIVGANTTAEQRAGRKNHRQRRREEKGREVREYLIANPYVPTADVAVMFDVPPRMVTDLWDGPRRPQRKRNVQRSQWHDAQITEHLRQTLAGGTNSLARYQELNVAGPSASLIVFRFGTWANAIRAAGLEANPAAREAAERDWDAELMQAVVQYARTPMPHSYRRFAEWGKRRRGPSPHTLRSWASITFGEALRSAYTIIETEREDNHGQ